MTDPHDASPAQYLDPTCIQGEIGPGCRSGDRIAPAVSADEVIAGLAERQHGVVARRQLLDLGLGPDAVKVRLGRGSLKGVHLGVYAVGHRLLGREGRWMAAVLAGGPGALLSHLSAARCWGLLRGDGLPEITRPGKFRQRPGIVARFASVPADERDLRDGIPLTSVPRTILDLAAVGTAWQVRRALHEAEVQQLTDRLSVPDLLHRYPQREGSRLLREVLEDGAGAGVTANEFEDRFAELLAQSDLPRPRFNPDMTVAGRHLRPDCAWPAQRLIVELDGRAAHGTKHAFDTSDPHRPATCIQGEIGPGCRSDE